MFNMKKIAITFIFLYLSNASLASDWVKDVETNGKGKLELVSNYFLFSSSTMVSIELPKAISEGDTLYLSYSKDGERIERKFPVAGISVRDDLCWIHSVIPQRHSNNVRDKIYIKPCKYK